MHGTRDVAITIARRTPVAKSGPKGALKDIRSDDLAAALLAHVIDNYGLNDADVADVILGCVNQANEQNRNVAKVVAILAGLPVTVPAQTVNRGCASSLDALIHGARAVALGDADLSLVGGLESMSRQPQGSFSSNNSRMLSSLGEDVISMGMTAENVANTYRITREDQDAWSLQSHHRAIDAVRGGYFDREVMPVDMDGVNLPMDNGPRPDSSLAALAALKPVFLDGGTVTAGNSSQTSDGASVCALTSVEYAKSRGLPIRARVIASAAVGYEPSLMGLGPVDAISAILKKTGRSLTDIDLFEVNEAFAAQTLGVIELAGLDPDRVNVNGGAIALGHAVGNSGTRLVVSLLHELERRDAELGVVTLCVGLGQAVAVMIERNQG